MLPFSDPRREALRLQLREFLGRLPRQETDGLPDAGADRAAFVAAGRAAIARLAEGGALPLCVPAEFGGAAPAVEPLSLVVAREEIAAVSGFHDAMFAVQGLAAHVIAAAEQPALRAQFLPGLAQGSQIGAFAATEPEAGSDLAAMTTVARRDGDTFVLEGHKSYISNAGLADLYVVFARVVEAAHEDPAASKAFGAFVVPADVSGLEILPIDMLAAHVMGGLRLRQVRVPADFRIDAPDSAGGGLGLCLRTLEIFRPTVGAAGCGMARRALEETARRVSVRRQFGGPLLEQQSVRFALAEMATKLAAARALVYRAAWLLENAESTPQPATARELTAASSMAKLAATEAAQEIVDAALQLHGAAGLVRGGVMERLYREVRALRIYEGASEIQKLVIARALFSQ